ncbi:hypothetical protein NKH58_29305 [Mesorhizobium australicum]|uniref:N,N-dimethylformamidase beta subunit family domain-containing protein n=1 Tax=Mesorhizobium australicum TaxID=536018 RepID=UPI003339CDE4
MSGNDETEHRKQPAVGPWPVMTFSGSGEAWQSIWVELPSKSGLPAAWCYSDKLSYKPGEKVSLFISSTVTKLDVEVRRDGLKPVVIKHWDDLSVDFQEVPAQSYMNGCSWRETVLVDLPEEVLPGAYIVELRDPDASQSEPALGHHIFFVRACKRDMGNTLLLMACTSTWAAYNDWGGASHYIGIHPDLPDGFSPILSSQRPWARGQVWLPPGAPRTVSKTRPRGPEQPYFGNKEWAFANGYARYYASGGWPSYERPFLLWAEAAGYDVHVIAQEDLELNPECIENYRCLAIVGHDEYWSTPMRQTVENYVDRGGKVARFGADFYTQIRLRERGSGQICYKSFARELDPIRNENPKLMTGCWEDPLIGYPGAKTFGVTGARGSYIATFGMAQRSSRGYIVFRHKHWSLEGTGLGYGDTFGDEASICAYEVDGLEYRFEDGLPEPTEKDGAPDGLEIIAMNFASKAEFGLPKFAHYLDRGDSFGRNVASMIEGTVSPEARLVEKHSRGSSMMVSFKGGRGEVFCAASTEWVNGLIERDFYADIITRNVLNKFLSL